MRCSRPRLDRGLGHHALRPRITPEMAKAGCGSAGAHLRGCHSGWLARKSKEDHITVKDPLTRMISAVGEGWKLPDQDLRDRRKRDGDPAALFVDDLGDGTCSSREDLKRSRTDRMLGAMVEYLPECRQVVYLSD